MTELRPQVCVLKPEAVAGALNRREGSDPIKASLKAEPWHRHAALCAALLMDRAEIARECNVHVNSIHRVFSDVGFQEQVNRILTERAAPAMEIFNQAVKGAALRIVDMSTNAKSETVRLAANKEICDRHMGKPVAVTQNETVVRSADPVAEAAELDARIRALTQPGLS